MTTKQVTMEEAYRLLEKKMGKIENETLAARFFIMALINELSHYSGKTGPEIAEQVTGSVLSALDQFDSENSMESESIKKVVRDYLHTNNSAQIIDFPSSR